MKKIVQSVEREYVDTQTGEVTTIETAKVFTERVKEDSFYMTFIDFVAPLYKLTSETARKLLTWMCEHAEFNTGKIKLTSADRKEIVNEFKVTNNTITNCLSTLKKLKLISGSSGNFEINPQIFWKGDLSIRRELLKDNDFQVKFTISEEYNTSTSVQHPN